MVLGSPEAIKYFRKWKKMVMIMDCNLVQIFIFNKKFQKTILVDDKENIYLC